MAHVKQAMDKRAEHRAYIAPAWPGPTRRTPGWAGNGLGAASLKGSVLPGPTDPVRGEFKGLATCGTLKTIEGTRIADKGVR